ncbi:MAG: HAD hydrolase family protein, partial [Nocardioidaceae bacterium]
SRAVSEHYCIDADVLRELVADLRDAVPQIAFAVERPDGMGRESAFVYRREASAHSTVGTLEEITGTPVGKLLGRCEEMDPVAFHRQVADVLRGRAELGYSGAVGLAEITAAGVTKAAALARWCSERQIDGRDVWAFGDMPNDLPMLEWAGTSFAVRNAHPDVLSAATYACASNDDDGVALVLETLANVRGPNDVGRR